MKGLRTIVRLVAFMRPFWGEVLLSVLLGVATVASGMGLAGTSAYLIATAALHPSVAVLEVAIVGVRFFGISRGVFRYLERLVSHSVNFRLLAGLRVWFYQALEPLAPACLEAVRGGELLDRVIADVETLEDFYVRMVAPPLVAIIVTLGTAVFIGGSAVALGWLAVAGMVVGGVILPVLTAWLQHRVARGLGAVRSRLSVETLDSLQGMTEWTAFGLEGERLARIATANQDYTQAQFHTARVGAAGSAAELFNQHLWVWALVVVGIPLVRSGAIDGVSLAVLALLFNAAFEAVIPLNQAAQQLEGALQAAGRLFELADQTPLVDEAGALQLPDGDFHIQIEQLSFCYPGNPDWALQDFSLDLPPGKRVALLGPNGAGKSTLVSLLLRFWDAPVGRVRVDGVDIRQLPAEAMRRRIALIPQVVYLFSGTLAENVRLAQPIAGPEELASAVERAGLDRLAQRLPQGLAQWVGGQGNQLSGGERQRVAAARAFLKGAGLLVMDEPVAHLDALSAREMLAQLAEFPGRPALLWITHDVGGLEGMDEILVLCGGRVIERGAPAQLAEAGGWYAQALALQRRVLA
jgi:ATP-binding cassette subfamily C protein CydC